MTFGLQCHSMPSPIPSQELRVASFQRDVCYLCFFYQPPSFVQNATGVAYIPLIRSAFDIKVNTSSISPFSCIVGLRPFLSHLSQGVDHLIQDVYTALLTETKAYCVVTFLIILPFMSSPARSWILHLSNLSPLFFARSPQHGVSWLDSPKKMHSVSTISALGPLSFPSHHYFSQYPNPTLTLTLSPSLHFTFNLNCSGQIIWGGSASFSDADEYLKERGLSGSVQGTRWGLVGPIWEILDLVL